MRQENRPRWLPAYSKQRGRRLCTAPCLPPRVEGFLLFVLLNVTVEPVKDYRHVLALATICRFERSISSVCFLPYRRSW